MYDCSELKITTQTIKSIVHVLIGFSIRAIFICISSFSNQFLFSGLDFCTKSLCEGKAVETGLAEKHEYVGVEAHLP